MHQRPARRLQVLRERISFGLRRASYNSTFTCDTFRCRNTFRGGSMRTKAQLLFAVIALILAGTWIGLAQQRRQVDEALLKTGSKSGDEWVSYGGNWAEQRYSPQDQINASNVSRLGLAWSTEIPVASGTPAQAHQENTPLVFNGVLYGITPWSIAYAVDLKTHKEIWRTDPQVDQVVWQPRICCGVVNRGLALYQGK